jgi:toxin ParE1/3/4
LARIFTAFEARFGADARRRYEVLVSQTIKDLLEDLERPGARVVDGRVHYHLRHSRSRVHGDRVRDPRHLLVVKVVGDELAISAVVHDAMSEGIRIEEGDK